MQKLIYRHYFSIFSVFFLIINGFFIRNFPIDAFKRYLTGFDDLNLLFGLYLFFSSFLSIVLITSFFRKFDFFQKLPHLNFLFILMLFFTFNNYFFYSEVANQELDMKGYKKFYKDLKTNPKLLKVYQSTELYSPLTYNKLEPLLNSADSSNIKTLDIKNKLELIHENTQK